MPANVALLRRDMPAFVEFLGGAAADLATRRLGDRPGRREHDLVGRSTEDVGRHFADAILKRLAGRRLACGGLDQDHCPLGVGGPIDDAEGRNAVLDDARNLADRLLDLLGIDMPARPDDDVLDASGHVDFAARHVGLVAAVEPPVAKQLTRLAFVAEVAGGRGWPAKLETSLAPIRLVLAPDRRRRGLRDPATAGRTIRSRVRSGRRASRAWPRPATQCVAIDTIDQRGSRRAGETRARRCSPRARRPEPSPPAGSRSAQTRR